MKLKKTITQLARCPREFPMETIMGICFFVIAVVHVSTSAYSEQVGRFVSAVESDILWLFVPLISLTFCLHKVSKWAYVASAFLFLPLMMLNLKPFLWTASFGFTYALAAILLVLGNRIMDNRPFGAHLLHVVTQLFLGLLVGGMFLLAVSVVVASFFYIFGLHTPTHIYQYISYFVAFIVAPLLCCFFVTRNEYRDEGTPRVLQIILNFILSPAVIVYTALLYAYFIKIAVTWNLPKGGVAYMVMAFVAVAMVGRLTQYILPKRHFDWFYNHFTWIAIPPLVMYWVGSIYRIRLYSFTEGRWYLMVAGLLMTAFVLMLLFRRTRRFQLMACISGVAIILFTYVPGISAKSIGLRCQLNRFQRVARELHLLDSQSNRLVEVVDFQRITRDSLLSKRYLEADDIICYLRKNMGRYDFEKRYGKWNVASYELHYCSEHIVPRHVSIELHKPVDVGTYSLLRNSLEGYQVEVANRSKNIVVKDSTQKVVLNYAFADSLRKHPQWVNTPESLLVYRNDSMMMVVPRLSYDSETGALSNYISSNDVDVLSKNKNSSLKR